MGRTIPSFRQLLEIERLSWSGFKKELPSKLDKRAFDEIFENAELYASYLSNAVNPVTLESVIMGCLFHNHKTLSEVGKEKAKSECGDFCDDVTADEINLKLKLLADNKPYCRNLLFDRICEKWKGLVYSLHKEDREMLLKMMLETCFSYGESRSQIMNDKDSEFCITFLFYVSLLIQQQKLINKICKGGNMGNEMELGKDMTLLDFMT
ncbi:MAG: hypothetical protein H0X50_08420 [Nitrosopumilus sp.]|nr:hypothetical protein [Nitrosopumilus sp.]